MEDAKTVLAGRAESALFNRAVFNSSRSGALSCAKSAPSQASAIEFAKRTSPKFSGDSGSRLTRAWRAFSKTARTRFGAAGSGS